MELFIVNNHVSMYSLRKESKYIRRLSKLYDIDIEMDGLQFLCLRIG